MKIARVVSGAVREEIGDLKRDPRPRFGLQVDIEPAAVLVPAQAFVGQWLDSFKEFPPRQKPGSFSLGDAMDKIMQGTGGKN